VYHRPETGSGLGQGRHRLPVGDVDLGGIGGVAGGCQGGGGGGVLGPQVGEQDDLADTVRRAIA
jgi:hypothetical protein